VTRNVAASVHQRLLNRAHAAGRPFNELLQYFVLERFLYRLGRSPYSGDFVLKGALMFGAWQGPLSRPTRDVDLLGRLDNDVERVVEVIRAICREPVPEDDGLRFQAEAVTAERITEAAKYEGVRVHLPATLGKARIRFQVDIGFGDVLVPGPLPVRLPTILDFPPPEVQGYSRESTIAEKFHAMVYLGEINSRMKDFYDVWLLATYFAFDGSLLARAVRETFRHQHTAIPLLPVAFGDAFAQDRERQAQWSAFIRRRRLESAPATLGEAVRVIAAFLQPVIRALIEERPFRQHWLSGGPWMDDI
jgi:hypothetical protein